MKASDLRYRITIQHPNGYTRDAEGNAKTNWDDLVTVWAARVPMTTRWREFFDSGATTAEMMVVYKIRYREGIRPSMKVVDGGRESREYNIATVLDDVDGRRRETHLLCREVTAGG